MLNALPKEYDQIIIVVNSKEELGSLDELESCIIKHESRLEKHQKDVLTKPVSVNMIHARSFTSPILTEQFVVGTNCALNFLLELVMLLHTLKIMVTVQEDFGLAVAAAILVVEEVALENLNVRYVTSLGMTHLYAIRDIHTLTFLCSPLKELPSIPL